MALKNRVKEFLQERKLSAYQFIKDTGISESTGYELARNSSHLPSIASLEKICDAYEIETSEIVVRVKNNG